MSVLNSLDRRKQNTYKRNTSFKIKKYYNIFKIIRKLVKYNIILMSIKCVFNMSAPRSGAGQLVSYK